MPNISLHYAGKVPAQERGQAELTDMGWEKKQKKHQGCLNFLNQLDLTGVVLNCANQPCSCLL